MKLQIIFTCIVILLSAELAQSADSDTARRAKLDNITSRVRAGDASALKEVSTVPAEFAVPYLMFWIKNSSSGKPQYEEAMKALKNVSGVVDYLKQEIEDTLAKGLFPRYNFIALGEIGTPEVAVVVAPYLFDDRQFELGHRRSVPAISAVVALKKMKFADAPQTETTNSRALIAWQKWAIAKGLVPKDWNSKVGAPKWMLEKEKKMEEIREAERQEGMRRKAEFLEAIRQRTPSPQKQAADQEAQEAAKTSTNPKKTANFVRMMHAQRGMIEWHPKDKSPKGWASGQYGLATALGEIARYDLDHKSHLFKEAEDARREVIEVFQKDTIHQHYADRMNMQAKDLTEDAQASTDPAKRALLLKEAIARYEFVTKLWSKEQAPKQYQAAQDGLTKARKLQQ